MESQNNNIQDLLLAIKSGKLEIMDPLRFMIEEICDSFLMDKYVAATTTTNLLLEEALKLALIISDSEGRTLDDNVDFENMYKDEVEENIEGKLFNNIEKAFIKGLIDESGKIELNRFRETFRNPFSHGSHNDAILGAKTIIATASIDDISNIQYKKISVKNQPLLYYPAKHEFLKREAIGYFYSVYKYVCSFDTKLLQFYKKPSK